MRLLVTGASGFIGARLIALLAERRHEVVALARAGAAVPPGVEALRHQLGDGHLVIPEGLDGVVHCAQSRAYRAFPGDAPEMFRVNVAGTQQLLEAAAAARVSRFCLVSTGTVYEPFAQPLKEDAALAPMSYLGASKLAAEVIAQPFGGLFALSVLRLFGPYGPGQTDRLVPDLIRRVSSGDAVWLPETGGGMRFAPSYVDDICDAIGAAVEQAWTGTINIGTPEVVSIEEAAHAIGRALGKTPRFERRPIGAPNVAPLLDRLAARYDLRRFRSLAEGLAATVGMASTAPDSACAGAGFATKGARRTS